jgi:hypothetical protein
MATLSVRTDLFDHGLFPLQPKVSSSILINLFANLNLVSSIDYKVKLKDWVE